jgi:hypothetical protein
MAREAVAPARTKIPRVAPQLPLRAANRQMPVAAIAENTEEISAKARATHRFDFRGDDAVYRRKICKSKVLENWWPGAESNHRHADFQSSQSRHTLTWRGGKGS